MVLERAVTYHLHTPFAQTPLPGHRLDSKAVDCTRGMPRISGQSGSEIFGRALRDMGNLMSGKVCHFARDDAGNLMDSKTFLHS